MLTKTSQNSPHFIIYIAKLQKIPFKATKHLCMTQKFSKVNVKHMPCVSEHYVIIVAVTNSQHISSYTASCTRVNEVFWSLKGREKKAKWDQISVGKQHSCIQQFIWAKPDKIGPKVCLLPKVCFKPIALQLALESHFPAKTVVLFFK